PGKIGLTLGRPGNGLVFFSDGPAILRNSSIPRSSELSMSGMTMTEKILAQHAGRDAAVPGDNIWVDTDILMTHDVCGPGTIGVFKKHFGKDAKVWDKSKLVLIPDHYIFTRDKKANRNVDVLRAFAREQDLPYFY